MPTTHDELATWLNPASISLAGDKLRRADSAAFAGAGSAVGVAGGVVRHGDTSLAVTVDASDVVTVQAGAVVIPGMPGLGCYRSSLSSSITLNPTTRNASNPRIDLIVFQMLDNDASANGGTYTARVSVIAGTPSATPSAPALPSMAVELARITLPNTGGGTATVDSTHRTYATAIGGRIPVASSAMLPAAAAKYQKAVALDTGVEYEWDGSTWRGGWIDFTPNVYSNSAPTTAVAVTRGTCRYKRVGDLVHAHAEITVTNAVTAPIVDLPVPGAYRQIPIGVSGIWSAAGPSAPSAQIGQAIMHTDLSKMVAAVNYNASYQDAGAANAIRYNVTYQV